MPSHSYECDVRGQRKGQAERAPTVSLVNPGKAAKRSEDGKPQDHFTVAAYPHKKNRLLAQRAHHKTAHHNRQACKHPHARHTHINGHNMRVLAARAGCIRQRRAAPTWAVDCSSRNAVGGDVAHMVERPLSMREVGGSMPSVSSWRRTASLPVLQVCHMLIIHRVPPWCVVTCRVILP